MATLTIHAQIVVPGNADIDLKTLAGCELQVLDATDLIAAGSVDERGFCAIDVPLFALLPKATLAVDLLLRAASQNVLDLPRQFAVTHSDSQPLSEAAGGPVVVDARIALTGAEVAHLTLLRKHQRDNQRAALRRRGRIVRDYAIRVTAVLFALDALTAFAAGKWPQWSSPFSRKLLMLAKLVASDALKGGFLHRVVNAAGAGASVVLMLLIAAAVFTLAQRLLGSAVDDLLKKIRELFPPGGEKGTVDPIAKAVGMSTMQALTAVVVVTGGVVAGSTLTNTPSPAPDTSKVATRVEQIDSRIVQIEKNLAITSTVLTNVVRKVDPLVEKATRAPEFDKTVAALWTEMTVVNRRMITNDHLRTAIDGVRKVYVPPPLIRFEPKITVAGDSSAVVEKLAEVQQAVTVAPQQLLPPLNELRDQTAQLVASAQQGLLLDKRVADGVDQVKQQTEKITTNAAIDNARWLALGPVAGRRTLWQRFGDVFTGERERFTINSDVAGLAPTDATRRCLPTDTRYAGREAFVGQLRKCWGPLPEDIQLKMVVAGRISY